MRKITIRVFDQMETCEGMGTICEGKCFMLRNGKWICGRDIEEQVLKAGD